MGVVAAIDGTNPAEETQGPQGGTIKVLLHMHPPLIDWCLRIRFGSRLHLPYNMRQQSRKIVDVPSHRLQLGE